MRRFQGMFPDAKQIWANAHAMVAGIVVGAAAMMSAVDEGLAGVVNAGVGYDEIAFSPRCRRSAR